MDKFLLFTTGTVRDYVNLVQSPMNDYVILNSKYLDKIDLTGLDILTLYFSDNKKTRIRLQVKRGFHGAVAQSILNAIKISSDSILVIADVDSNSYVNTNIRGVEIVVGNSSTLVQTLTDDTRLRLNTNQDSHWKSLMVANIDGTHDVTCTLELNDGAAYTKLLDQVSIPPKATLVLDEDEISYEGETYALYAQSGDADGQLTFTFRK